MIRPTLAYLNDVYLSRGMLGRVEEIAASYGLLQPLVVTDPILREWASLSGRGCPTRQCPIAADTNPTDVAAREAVSIYKSEGCKSVVAIGGGSSINLAKIVALVATHSDELSGHS